MLCMVLVGGGNATVYFPSIHILIQTTLIVLSYFWTMNIKLSGKSLFLIQFIIGW